MIKTKPTPLKFRFALAILATVATCGISQIHAASGEELLMGALPASSVNRSQIDKTTLVDAVSQAVSANKRQAPEIVGAAITKTNSLATQNAIVRAAINALGDEKSDSSVVPQIVYAAVRNAPNCGGSDSGYDKDGYSKDSSAGCECAEQFTRTAIEALGSNPSEKMVVAITTSAIQALDGRCADRIVNAASQAAPQYASSIADAGARAGRGSGEGRNADGFANGDGSEGVVFSPTGRPVPAAFVLPPSSSNGGGVVPDTTPVN